MVSQRIIYYKDGYIQLFLQYARYFYLGQWLRDNQLEIERLFQQSSDSHNNTDTGLDDDDDRMVASPSVQLLHQAEVTKEFIMNLMKPMPPSVIE